MANQECKFETLSSKPTEGHAKKNFRGLFGGKSISLRMGKQGFSLQPNTLNPEADIIYNLPTRTDFLFPFHTKATFQSSGSALVPALAFQLQTPARVTMLEPKLNPVGVSVSRNKGLRLRWKTGGSLEYIVVRFNQRLEHLQQLRTLFCRLDNTGEATLSPKNLQRLAADPKGKSTRMYVMSTSYKLAQIQGFSAPLLVLVRTTSTVTVQLK